MTKNEDLKSCLMVDSGGDEPLRIYHYKDGDVGSLNTAVRDAMFCGDISTEQESEVAGITGDLLHDGEYCGEDFTFTLRSVWTSPTVTPTDGKEWNDPEQPEWYNRLSDENKQTVAKIIRDKDLITPADTAMEDAAQREPAAGKNSAPVDTSSTTDGDAERALEAVQAWFDSIEWREETGKPFKYKDSEEVLYKHGETIRTALQTRRAFRTEDASDEDIAAVETAKYGKHPVDTIAVPREVLQGVRDDIQYERNKIFYLMIRGSASEYDVGLAKERLTKTLASLDAVLSEGK